MNREALDRWCERGILGLVLTILVLGPLAMGAVRPSEYLIIQGLTVGVMLLWGARLWLNPRPQLLWPPICWAVAGFTVYVIIRYFTSDIEYLARQELIRLLLNACLFFAILNNLHRQESIQVINCTLILLAMAIACYAGYQFLAHSNRVWRFEVPLEFGASGTYISRNHLGGFLEMLLPLALAYTLLSRLGAVAKVFLGYASLVILAGIVFTISRGTYASTAVALLLFFGVLLFHRTYRLPALVLLAVILAAGVYFLPRSYAFRVRFGPLVAEDRGGRLEDDSRIILWQSALRLWRQNVWWGVGLAHYDARFPEFRPVAMQLRPYFAHNDYLQFLTEWGLAGIGLMACVWGLLGLGLCKIWPCVRTLPRDIGEQRSSNKFAFVLGAALGLTAILVHSAVDFNMHIPANAILAVSLMALLSSCLRFATERYWVKVKWWGKALGSVVVLASAAYLGYQGWRSTTEYVWLQRAARAPLFSPEQAACLTNAFVAEPMNSETAYAIGEVYRIRSAEGGDNYRELAEQAMVWFERSLKLNPWYAYSHLRYAWCLDWLGRFAESLPYFQRADQLEPNGYYMAAHIGLHYLQAGNFAAAKPWFERSLQLERKDNPLATNYLPIVKSRLLEAATNEFSARLNLAPQ
jgi:O-antigen ligase/tetratricopeptide (TPR) repeat protein